MHIGFLGFGLIAGSIARAVRAGPSSSSWTMVAWSPTGEGPRRAALEGILDGAAPDVEHALAGADLLVLAAPVPAGLELIDGLAGPWRAALSPETVVTDVASTKALIMDRADAAGLRFVGGHPMAGRETAGYDAAQAHLFVDRPWIVVPGAHAGPADMDRVASLARACSARVVPMGAASHDRAVAGVSHLPLIASVALVEAVAGLGRADRAGDDWSQARALAASGWRDATRLARGDAAMGSGIIATNATEIASRLREYRAVLDSWIADLERDGGPDEPAIAERLRAARARLDE